MYTATNDTPSNLTDHNDHHHHDHDEDHNITNRYLSICYILIALFICFGNCATLLAIFCNHKLKTIPNMYIGSLAVADLMVGLMVFVQGISELDITDHFEQVAEEFCLARMSMLFVSVAASMLSYLLVACDRYVYIMHSLKYANLVTKKRSMIFILVAWVLACAYGTVPAYTSHFNIEEGCAPTHVFSFVYMIIVHPAFFFTLGAITFWLYLRIVAAAMSQQKRIRDQEVSVQNQPGQMRLSQRTWKVVKILMLVFGFFLLCWCPLLILAFLEYTIHVDHLCLSIAGLVAVMNSGVNFLVLAALKKDFRTEFRRILCFCCGECSCCCEKAKVHPTGISTVLTSHWVSSHE